MITIQLDFTNDGFVIFCKNPMTIAPFTHKRYTSLTGALAEYKEWRAGLKIAKVEDYTIALTNPIASEICWKIHTSGLKLLGVTVNKRPMIIDDVPSGYEISAIVHHLKDGEVRSDQLCRDTISEKWVTFVDPDPEIKRIKAWAKGNVKPERAEAKELAFTALKKVTNTFINSFVNADAKSPVDMLQVFRATAICEAYGL